MKKRKKKNTPKYTPSKERVAVPDKKPLHNCKFEYDLATVSLKRLEKVVPDFLKKKR